MDNTASKELAKIGMVKEWCKESIVYIVYL